MTDGTAAVVRQAAEIQNVAQLVRQVADLTRVRGITDMLARVPGLVQSFDSIGRGQSGREPTDSPEGKARSQGEIIGRAAGEIVARAVREAAAAVQSGSTADSQSHQRAAETGNVFQSAIDHLRRKPQRHDHRDVDERRAAQPWKPFWERMFDDAGRVTDGIRQGTRRTAAKGLEVFGKYPLVRRTVKGGRFGDKVRDVGFVRGGLQGAAGAFGRFPGFATKVKIAGPAAAGPARGAVGAAAGALGGVAAAGGLAVGAVTALATAAKAASDKAAEWTKAAEDSARKLADISPQMTAIIQKLDAERLRRDMRTAAETAESTQRLADQQSRLEEALRPIQADITNLQNEVTTVINDVKIAVVEEVLSPMWEALKPILANFVDFGQPQKEQPAIFGNFLADRRAQLQQDEQRRAAAQANLDAARRGRG